MDYILQWNFQYKNQHCVSVAGLLQIQIVWLLVHLWTNQITDGQQLRSGLCWLIHEFVYRDLDFPQATGPVSDNSVT